MMIEVLHVVLLLLLLAASQFMLGTLTGKLLATRWDSDD